MRMMIGENLGILLETIAIEKLGDFDLGGAINTFTESLGCSEEVALKILLGDYILRVQDSEKCLLNVRPREDISEEELSDHPSIDFHRLECRLLELFQTSRDIEYKELFYDFKNKLDKIEDNLYMNKTITLYGSFENILDIPEDIEDSIDFSGSIEISYRKMVEIILNEKSNIFEDIEWNREYSEAYYILEKLKETINKKDKIIEVAEFLENHWEKHRRNLKKHILDYLSEINSFLEFLNAALNNNLSIINYEPREDIVSKHLKASFEIDKVLEKFGPSDIKIKYDAGWLSRDGKYFGLNGEVSNLLHVTLANAIFDYYEWPDPEDGKAKDWALEDMGFVKITGKTILFSGYDYALQGRAPRKLTLRQIDKIYEYGLNHYKGELIFGYSGNNLSVEKFRVLDDEELENLFTQ